MGIADLTSPRAKLGRAYEHLAALNEEFRRFAEQDANTVHTTYRREGDWYVVELGPIPPVPPRIALIAGDCLNNIRTALDHLVWQLVLREDQNPQKTNRFPICEARDQFINEVETPAQRGKKSPLCGITVNGDAWAIIEAVQPYHCPQPQMDPLAVLSRLVNADKHHALLLQQSFLSPMFDAQKVFWGADIQPVEVVSSQVPLSPERPTEVGRYRFAPGVDPRSGFFAGGGVDAERQLRVDPTIGDGIAQAGLPVLAVACQHVGEILDKVAGLPGVQS